MRYGDSQYTLPAGSSFFTSSMGSTDVSFVIGMFPVCPIMASYMDDNNDDRTKHT